MDPEPLLQNKHIPITGVRCMDGLNLNVIDENVDYLNQLSANSQTDGSMAQLAKRLPSKQEIAGSIPTGAMSFLQPSHTSRVVILIVGNYVKRGSVGLS